ncbi:hypothetical protein Scep_016819 [Stephania cephalantha]|uniref:Uncharacterized protein n=1 Tax=Stephania cephalantha TaxID=152367 RepID=A0AAP0IQ79_9MAGN
MNDCRKNIDERPSFVTQEIWEGYLAHWSTPEYVAMPKQGSKNMMSEKKGLEIYINKHTGGKKSFSSHKEMLDEKAGGPMSVNLLFNYIDTKCNDNVTFVNKRSRKFHEYYERRLEEMTQASPDVHVDEDERFY